MTNFLIKTFIKDKNSADLKTREKYGTLSGGVGIVLNVILSIFKFIIGIITNSVSITADAVNNLTDASSSVVTILGTKLAGKPVDKDHPFGHGRMEYISALVVSFFIFLMGFELGKSSIAKIINPEEVKFSIVSIVVLGVAIVAKLWLAYFNHKLYKITGNINMKAVMQDSLNDSIATGATMIALAISAFTPFKRADGIIGIIVTIIIIIAGVQIVKDIIDNLLGKAPDPELVNEIESLMLQEEKIVGVHDLIVHDYGPGRIIASAHAEVPCNIDVMKLHDIIDNTEKRISKKLNIIICIHMDPVIVDDERIDSYKSFIKNIIKEYDERFSFHDFRVVEGPTHTNFIFDLVIPHEYDKDNNTILNDIKAKVKESRPDVFLVVTVEHSFV